MKSIIFLFVMSAFLDYSCRQNFSPSVDQSLGLAGENRQELEKVLKHYRQNDSDSLKLKAARFLVENMPGHFSYDSTDLYRYRPVIDTISAMRNRGLSLEVIKGTVNPLMDSLITVYPLSEVYSQREDDLSYIKSDMLMSNIDMAFKYYDHNPFKDSILFEDFLEYVLPYRIQDGYCLEDWRSYFTQHYSLKDASNVHQLCDSLLYNFKEVGIVWSIADQFPYLKLTDYLKSRITRCPQKSWFNCMLLSSFGIPTTIDFVPASRVHPLGHEWNVIKLKNGIYPFDPFWTGYMGNSDVRYLRSFYERKKTHPGIGPIQFPKIYRQTYKKSISELLKHAIRTGEKIPPLFGNPFLQDVTNQYFKTYSIETKAIVKAPDVDYAYACVTGYRQTWVPVDFGKINKGKISFTSLGSVNVYLPTYYKSGSLVPAAYPVLINKDGSTSILHPDTLCTRTIEVVHVAYPQPQSEEYKKSFVGCTIEGADNPAFRNSQVLYRLNKAYEPGTHRIPLQTNKKYRFFRFRILNSKIKINEINFVNTGKETKSAPIYSFPEDSFLLKRIIDGDKLTGADLFSLREEHKQSDNIWIGCDFKHPVSVRLFEFYYVFYSSIRDGGIYELLYWDFGWKSLDKKESNSTKPISFDHVPENALLMIKILDTDKYSRPFTYSQGKQHWW